jgi:hypothetical protein
VDDKSGGRPDQPVKDAEKDNVRPGRIRTSPCSGPTRCLTKRQHAKCGRTRMQAPMTHLSRSGCHVATSRGRRLTSPMIAVWLVGTKLALAFARYRAVASYIALGSGPGIRLEAQPRSGSGLSSRCRAISPNGPLKMSGRRPRGRSLNRVGQFHAHDVRYLHYHDASLVLSASCPRLHRGNILGEATNCVR